MDKEQLQSLLLDAYQEARKHKRNTVNQLQFESNLESNLLDLAEELCNGSYEISRSICFINEKPVKREIVAANFRDRVVHHLLFNWINPMFERQFIYDSYSCRTGKGTDFAIRRAKHFIVSESRNFTRACWSLRLDVSGFFMNVNRNILYSLIVDGLNRCHWGMIAGLSPVPDRVLCLDLIKKFVFNDPLKNVVYKSPASAWNDLPANKSLREASPDCGLPIGNLTSQLFGNVYLNPLDHFIKRRLGVRCYGRYVDDMLLVSCRKEELLCAIPAILRFLRERLGLTLHPHKISLQPVERGFQFLGAFVLPYRTYPGRRVVKNFRECLMNPDKDCLRQKSRVCSYEGFMKHYDAWNLCRKLKKLRPLLSFFRELCYDCK